MKPIFVRGISNQFRLTLAIMMSVVLLVANERLEPYRQSLASFLSPIQYLANVPGAVLDWSAESLATRNMLAKQNKDLLRQQLLMSERLQRFEHLRQENDRLRALLGSPLHMDSRKVVAEVMEVASDPFHHYVVVNHGAGSGVFVGQPVVDAQGIVGQVVQVNELTARVLLISDESHGIPVRITRNDVRLVAKGIGRIDEIELQYVAKSTDIEAGDLIVSSGLGKRFPEGYPVARITDVTREDGQSYAKVRAKPLAALDRVRYLLLIWPDIDATKNREDDAANAASINGHEGSQTSSDSNEAPKSTSEASNEVTPTKPEQESQS
ncbi:rod shape-determining protein MreC [Shewanella gelidii]|uniref:Cell shape-determining protein MreC n=1 Tax=Shewanella gelidii TaxID=1642821 RepID=A0A917NC14_9GAMM|nr:rod shape-determining protein MreC [Shewanella gelidii]MCL1098763.1 rod shape-determining protein MreC [Shewanella gelidii]GGI87786.1 rod shape-determining protein MreC [Shewanella gelidii]